MDSQCRMMEGKRTDPMTGIKENIKEGSKGISAAGGGTACFMRSMKLEPWFPLHLFSFQTPISILNDLNICLIIILEKCVKKMVVKLGQYLI